jgi:lipopolysaccharide export LptBFGC system permease protein LptF
MTAEHPVRRALARLCSAETMAHVVDPTLADARFEDGRLTRRGYLALVRALTLHAVVSLPGRAVRVYAEDAHAIPRLAALSVVAALLTTVPLVARPLMEIATDHSPVSRGWLAITLLPQAIALALPAALLVAIPVALRRAAPSTRLVVRVLTLSALYAGLTFLVIERIVPAANQSFRTAVSGIGDLRPGPMEIPSAHLRREIDRLRTFQGGTTIIRRLEYAYEQRLSLSSAALPIAALALACAFAPFGRRWPLLTGMAALTIYIYALFGFDAYVAEPALRASTVPAESLAWVPNAFMILIAGALTAGLRSASADGRA